MGFLTDVEKSDLRIISMALHVVGGGEFTPEAAREVEHEEFFVARIQDTDIASVYSFDPESQTKAAIERIATGQVGFEEGAQHISREFSRLHGGASRDGAFFIFELESDAQNTKIYSLIKYDYREAIEQSNADHGPLLRRIVHAFIADKKAIQKSALVRVVNGVAELAISTRDRMKQAPAIGDYFASFLHATRTLSDQELSEKTVTVLREALTACKEHLPERDVPQAFRHAKGVLRDRQEINEEAIIDAIIAAAGNPESEEVRGELEAKTRRKIRSARIEGIAFRPDRQIFRRPPQRKVRTIEGVTLIYPDDTNDLTVRRERNADGGGEIITIRTEQITEDSLVRDSAR